LTSYVPKGITGYDDDDEFPPNLLYSGCLVILGVKAAGTSASAPRLKKEIGSIYTPLCAFLASYRVEIALTVTDT
jgi:hypothetical protein